MLFNKSLPFPQIPPKVQNLRWRSDDSNRLIPANVGNKIHRNNLRRRSGPNFNAIRTKNLRQYAYGKSKSRLHLDRSSRKFPCGPWNRLLRNKHDYFR